MRRSSVSIVSIIRIVMLTSPNDPDPMCMSSPVSLSNRLAVLTYVHFYNRGQHRRYGLDSRRDKCWSDMREPSGHESIDQAIHPSTNPRDGGYEFVVPEPAKPRNRHTLPFEAFDRKHSSV